MSQNQPKIKFQHFLEKFPEVDLPITLGEDTHHVFSNLNGPLSALMIEQYFDPLEEAPSDETTEYIACFKIKDTLEFHAVVYWRASLMEYHYMLVTFTKTGDLIDQRTIAGTFYDGNSLTQSVATIDEDWEIHIVSGQAGVEPGAFDPTASRVQNLELLPDGMIAEA